MEKIKEAMNAFEQEAGREDSGGSDAKTLAQAIRG
jgi:hypothetical protein